MDNLFNHDDTDDLIFNHVKGSDCKSDIRDYINNLWDKFKHFCPDNHLKFKEGFSRDLISRWWELYLGNVLHQYGYKFLVNNGVGPDFRVQVGNKIINIEAIAPSSGNGVDAAPDYPKQGFVTYSDEPLILRLTHAVREKNKKIIEYLESGVISDTDINIIAINLSKLDMANEIYRNIDDSIIGKAFFGFDQLKFLISINLEMGTSGHPSPCYDPRETLLKRSGSDVSTISFAAGTYPNVSGVFCSAESFVNLPTDGKGIWHLSNPTARIPLSCGIFPFGVEWIAEINGLHIQLSYNKYY